METKELVGLSSSRPTNLPQMSRLERNNSLLTEVCRQQDLVKQKEGWCNYDAMTRYYIVFLGLPLAISLFYAIAILFPPEAREKVSALLWTDGALTRNDDGDISLCPRESICSTGIFQIFLISISRLTAFASYVFMAQTFFSKMHCSIHALSTTHIATMIPFPTLHDVHRFTGKCYGVLALLHTITHIIRWAIRKDLDLLGSTVGLSGVIGILCILSTILSMSPLAKRFDIFTFELRFLTHWVFFSGLILALCFHTPRCRIITMLFW